MRYLSMNRWLIWMTCYLFVIIPSTSTTYCQWNDKSRWGGDSSQIGLRGKPVIDSITVIFDGLTESDSLSVVTIYSNIAGRASAILVDSFELIANSYAKIPVFENEEGLKYIKTSVGDKTLDQLRSLRVQVKGKTVTDGKRPRDRPFQRIEFQRNQNDYYIDLDKQ